MPYRRHRYSVAAFFGVDESYIWPGALDQEQVAAAAQSEIVAVYPHRWAVPRETWEHFFAKAEQDIGALVYSGMFMAEDVGVHRLFADRARSGARVRILLGDPDSPHVAERGASEGIDEGMAAKVRNSIVLFRPLQAIENVEIRLHGHDFLQLDLPRRRSAPRQHAYLRDDGQQRTRLPSAQGGRRRHGQHISGELRARLGRRDTI